MMLETVVIVVKVIVAIIFIKAIIVLMAPGPSASSMRILPLKCSGGPRAWHNDLMWLFKGVFYTPQNSVLADLSR